MRKLTAILFLVVYTINAQEILTIEKLTELVKNKNIQIKQAHNNQKLNENNTNPGLYGFLPKIDFITSSTFNDNEVNQNGVNNDVKSSVNSLSIRASYTLFDGLSNFNNYKKSKQIFSKSVLQNRNVTEKVLLTAINIYLNIAKLEEQVDIQKEALKISGERLKRIENALEFGKVNSLEFLSAKVDFNRDSLNLLSTQTLLHHSKEQLNSLLNRKYDFEFSIDRNIDFDNIPNFDKLKEETLSNNSEYISAIKEIEISESQVSISRAAFLPVLSVSANYGYNNSLNGHTVSYNNLNRNTSISLNLSYNLFNGFANKINIENSKILLQNSELEKEQLKSDLLTRLSNTYKQYKDDLKKLQMEEDNLKFARLNFERSEELYKLGKITITDFREAQLKYIQSKLNISEIKYEIKYLESQLKQLSGSLL